MNDKQLKALLQMVNHASIIAWEGVASTVLSPRSRQYILNRNEEFLTLKHRHKVFQQFCKEHNYLAKKNPIIGWVTNDPEDIDKTCSLLLQISQLIPTKKGVEWAVAEVLAKVLAYRNLQPNQEIDIPLFWGKEKCGVRYRVDKRFNLWKEMRAFGLVPLEKGFPPFLLFRGTDFSLLSNSSRISIVSNFDPLGPGYSIYNHARKAIKSWLDKVCGRSESAVVMGYSLGGALASYALAQDSEYFSQTSPSYIFNHPGFSEEIYSQWIALKSDKRPLLRAFVSDGDVVSKYGFLFSDTYGIKHPQKIPPIQAHTKLLFLQNSIRMKMVDLEKENASRSRKHYSKLHKHTASVFYNIGLKFLFPNP